MTEYQSDDLIGFGCRTILGRFEGLKNCLAYIECQALFKKPEDNRLQTLVSEPKPPIKYVSE
ncbi:MAG: hypothetical protein HYT69_02220 [Candidatus Zambryskibacteria bacterium]|nr:hypothetical protein [Candidatus Zambryskibacteria bacterium]